MGPAAEADPLAPAEFLEAQIAIVVGVQAFKDRVRGRGRTGERGRGHRADELIRAHTQALTDPAQLSRDDLAIERFRREEAVGALVRNPGERERILLTCHGATWAREVAPYTRPWGGTGNVFPAWDFNRGFVAAVGASATVVADKDCPLPRLPERGRAPRGVDADELADA